MEAVRQLTVHQVTRVDELASRAGDAYFLTRHWVLALGAAATLLGILLSCLITRAITRPLAAAVALARRVAAGDLSVRAQPAGRDEAAQLLRGFASMAEDLRSLVGEVQAGARIVSQASARLALGHADLSERTEQQAAALEQTASSMEELTCTVAQNADSARRARDLAAGASGIAQVNDLIADIAAASEQQSSGIGQVNAAVAQMDREVQQNALLVEQAVAATQAMEAQAAALLRLVSRFRLDAAPPLLAEDGAAATGWRPIPPQVGPAAARA